MKIWFKTQTFSRFVRGSRGFTLSELAVALVVTGILVGIAVPNFLGNRNNSFDKDAQASIDVVLQAAKMHYQTYGDFSDGISTQCGDTSVLAADLQRLEPGIDVVIGTSASTNSRMVSVQAVNTWNSGNESLGCQGFYAVALSSSGSCWAARLTVEGKYLATGSVSPIVLATEANTNNSEITPLSNTAVNGLAYAALKPTTSGADGTNSNGIAAIAAACKAKTHSTGVATVSGAYIAPSQFYSTWRDAASGGTTTNNTGPEFSLSSSSESVVQNVAMTGYTITSTGTAITSYSISPSAPAGTSFDTATGLLSGSPTTVRSATLYTITATNEFGTGTATFILAVTVEAPGTPLVEVVPGNTQATVTVAAGTGGTPSSYTVSASPQVSGVTKTCTVTGASGSCIVTGLTNGVDYTFTATASNASATSAASSATDSITPDLPCGGGGACTVGVTPGPSGGPLIYYSATAFTSIGSACGTDCHYLEAAPTGWIVSSEPAGQTNCRPAALGEWTGTGPDNGTSTLDPGCYWAIPGTDVLIGATAQGTAIGTGYANTTALIDSYSSANSAIRAASVARAYQGGGYTDWYLPSKDELNELCKYAKRQTLGNAATACAYNQTIRTGFSQDATGTEYASSTEVDGSNTYTSYFSYGLSLVRPKGSAPRVRPVRAF
jgi:prepilin-type N-terminal cleavage/methylation domain-containing protein